MFRSLSTLLAILVWVSPLLADDLEATLKPIAAAHKGEIAIAVKHLGTGQRYTLNADTPMPTASLIKTAIMVEAFCQSDEKLVDLGKPLTYTKDDQVPGSGVLTYHFSHGASFPLRDAVRLMIVYSDNTATNMVLDQVGLKTVNARMEKLGLPNTKVHSKVYKRSTSSVDLARSEKFGLGSTTANESIKLVELIHTNAAAGKESCAAMMKNLQANEDKELLARFFPEGTVFAHKTGAVSDARTDCGIVFVPDPSDAKKKHAIAVCVLTNKNDDKRWILDNAAQVTIAKIGQAVYQHFAKK
jgi:beta-lactamase class A